MILSHAGGLHCLRSAFNSGLFFIQLPPNPDWCGDLSFVALNYIQISRIGVFIPCAARLPLKKIGATPVSAQACIGKFHAPVKIKFKKKRCFLKGFCLENARAAGT